MTDCGPGRADVQLVRPLGVLVGHRAADADRRAERAGPHAAADQDLAGLALAAAEERRRARPGAGRGVQVVALRLPAADGEGRQRLVAGAAVPHHRREGGHARRVGTELVRQGVGRGREAAAAQEDGLGRAGRGGGGLGAGRVRGLGELDRVLLGLGGADRADLEVRRPRRAVVVAAAPAVTGRRRGVDVLAELADAAEVDRPAAPGHGAGGAADLAAGVERALGHVDDRGEDPGVAGRGRACGRGGDGEDRRGAEQGTVRCRIPHDATSRPNGRNP